MRRARHGSRFTRRFEDTTSWLAVHTDKTSVSELMRVSWCLSGASPNGWLPPARVPSSIARRHVSSLASRLLPESRSSHEATLLLDGRVLVVGGKDIGNHRMSTTLLYDPVTDKWNDAGSLSEARAGHSATLFPDGSVLVAGGSDDYLNYLCSAELFDSVSKQWRNVAKMPFARSGHGAAPLPDGRILLIGGATGETRRSSVVLSTTVLYGPKTDTWVEGPSLPAARSYAHVLWNEEFIYLIGGYDENEDPTDTVFRLNR